MDAHLFEVAVWLQQTYEEEDGSEQHFTTTDHIYGSYKENFHQALLGPCSFFQVFRRLFPKSVKSNRVVPCPIDGVKKYCYGYVGIHEGGSSVRPRNDFWQLCHDDKMAFIQITETMNYVTGKKVVKEVNISEDGTMEVSVENAPVNLSKIGILGVSAQPIATLNVIGLLNVCVGKKSTSSCHDQSTVSPYRKCDGDVTYIKSEKCLQLVPLSVKEKDPACEQCLLLYDRYRKRVAQKNKSAQPPKTLKTVNTTADAGTELSKKENAVPIASDDLPAACVDDNGDSRTGELNVGTGTRTGETPFKCGLCKKAFAGTLSLNRHIKWHAAEKPFKCDVCEKSYSRKGLFLRHRAKRTGNESKYTCIECKKLFCYMADLKAHIRTHAVEKRRIGTYKAVRIKGYRITRVTSNTGRKLVSYTCRFCDKAYSQLRYLFHHLKPIKRGKLRCDICRKAFDKRCVLSIHRRMHAKEKPFQCNACDKAFSTEAALKKHTAKHSVATHLKCDVCERVFDKRASFNVHMRSHRGVKPFTCKCQICGKAFTSKYVLKQHTKIHSGEKAYKCDACDKAFGQRSHLEQHVRAVHAGEKAFQCEVCGKAFSRKYGLTSHTNVHTGRKCAVCHVCGLAVSNDAVLRCHMTKHTGERPYLCSRLR